MKKDRRKFKSFMNKLVVENMAETYSLTSLHSTIDNAHLVKSNAVRRNRWRAKHKQCVKHAQSTIYKQVKKF